MIRRLIPVGLIGTALVALCAGGLWLNSTVQGVLVTTLDPTRALALQIAATQTATAAQAQATAQAVQAAQAQERAAELGAWPWVLVLLLVGLPALALFVGWVQDMRLDQQATDVAAQLDLAAADDVVINGVVFSRRALQANPALALEVARIEAQRAIGVAQADRAVPETLHYNYSPQWQGTAAPAGALPTVQTMPGPELGTPATAPTLPAPFAFSQGVLGQGWRPSTQGIYLATQPSGQWLLLPPKDAMHGMMAGTTGGGKSNIFMMWIAQLLAARVHVVYLNPHAMQWDEEHRVDWRPINAVLGDRLIRDLDAIVEHLRWLCEDELPARKERGWHGEPVGPLMYTFVDEWPALIKHDKRAADYYAILVREGRKYGLYLVTAAQDALVKTLGGSSGERKQFQVVYYVGGEKYTKAAMLDLPQDAPEPTEVGLAYIKVGNTPAMLARVPLMDNPALYTLLGWPPSPPPWGWDAPPPGGAWVDTAAPIAVAPAVPSRPAPTAAATNGYETAVTARTATLDWPFDPAKVDPAKVVQALALFRASGDLTGAIVAAFGVNKDSPSRFNPPRDAVLAMFQQYLRERED